MGVSTSGFDREERNRLGNVEKNLPSIAVGVLNYNRADEVVDALRTLSAINYPTEQLHLILLDNASSDNSVERTVEEFGDRVEILQMKRNIGPVARNYVMLNRSEDYVFMFDEDCRPEHPDTIANVVKFMEAEPEFGALCFSCWNPRLGIREFGHPGTHYRKRWPGGTYEGMYVIGAGMCFRRSAVEKIEGSDERLFWGGEELDLGLELLRNDIRIAFHLDFVLVHNQARQAHTSKRAAELDMRNNIWIAVRRFPLLLSPLVLFFAVGRRIGIAILKRDTIRLTGYLRGVHSALVRLPEFLATRRPVRFAQLIAHRRWFKQMFYAPRNYAASHKRAIETILQPHSDNS
ncbi:MAG: glycosyltransferase family 2 protein [Candidatus Kapaibacterium sp.]